MSDNNNDNFEVLYSQHLKIIQGIKFSRRQVDVMACIVSGWDVKSVANLLGISPSTVETHIDVIVQKLGSGGRNSIIHFVERSGKDKEIKQYYQLLKVRHKDSKTLSEQRFQNRPSTLDANQTLKPSPRFKFILIGLIVIATACAGVFYKELKDSISGGVQQNFVARSDLTIPHENRFLNRPKILKQIDEKLKNQKGIKTVALVGIGGAGKTTLARQYARSQKAPIVWEINAETEESLLNSIEKLAFALCENEEERKELREIERMRDSKIRNQRILLYVQRKLRARSQWFLIYDNIETLARIATYIPQDENVWGKGSIVITSRDKNIQQNSYLHSQHVIDLDQLNTEEKLELFTKIHFGCNIESLEKTKKQQTLAFLEDVPPFPLDVSTAAYYIKGSNISYNEYLHRIQQQTSEFETTQQSLVGSIGPYKMTRYGIVSFSLQNIIQENSDFRDLLFFISLMDSQNIPKEVLEKFKENFKVEELIRNLRKYSLMTEEKKIGNIFTISFHRSLHRILSIYLKNLLNKKDSDALLSSIVNLLQNYMWNLVNAGDLIKVKLMIPHCETLLSFTGWNDKVSKGSFKTILGRTYFLLGNYLESEHQFKDSFENLKEYKDQETILVVENMRRLAGFYRELARYKESEDLLDECINIYKKKYGSQHIEIADLLQQLGLLYVSQGKYKNGKILFKQCLEIQNKHYSKNNIELKKVFLCLGIVYNHLGKYQQTIDYMHQIKKLCDEHFGPDHSGTNRMTWVYAHLGNSYNYLGDYQSARGLLEKSVALRKAHYGEEHLRTAWGLVHLGHVYYKLGKYKEAKGALEQSLKINIKEYGLEGQHRAWSSAHLACVYNSLGEYENARKLFENCIPIYEGHFGKEHALTAWILVHLGDVYNNLGDLEKAKNLLEKSREIYSNFYGQNHIRMIRPLLNLGRVYGRLQNYEAAEAILNQAVQICKMYFTPNPNHILTAQVLEAIGYVYFLKGDFKAAKVHLNGSLNMFYKNKHPGIYKALESLAELYFRKASLQTEEGDTKQKKYRNIAISYLSQALEQAKTYFDLNSLQVIRIQNKLGLHPINTWKGHKTSSSCLSWFNRTPSFSRFCRKFFNKHIEGLPPDIIILLEPKIASKPVVLH